MTLSLYRELERLYYVKESVANYTTRVQRVPLLYCMHEGKNWSQPDSDSTLKRFNV